MMRLADWLLRWTGEARFADYWERNLWNGILAQQHDQNGIVAYFLPLQAGAHKRWGTPTADFWCCHGTLLEAHTVNERSLFFADDAGLVVSQLVPAELTWSRDGVAVSIRQTADPQLAEAHRPRSTAVELAVHCERPADFALKVRLPWWVDGEPVITVDGERVSTGQTPSGYAEIRRVWHEDRVSVNLPAEA